jgi:P-type conjugative transfer ATPase TrbB
LQVKTKKYSNPASERFWTEDAPSWFCRGLKNEKTLELNVNCDGTCWEDNLETGLSQVAIMTAQEVDLFARRIASFTGSYISADNPILEAELPDAEARVAIIYPPCVAASIISVRRKASRLISLDEYVETGNLTPKQAKTIRRWILERKNILVVGGTSSGKTTFLNGLMAEIAVLTPDHRLVVLEDTVELQRFAKNVIQLRSVEHVPLQTLVKTTLRHRPDRIIVGEVRGKEVFDLLTAWSTGHPGGLASIHANSAEGAFSRLEQLLEIAVQSPMQPLIGEALDAIIYMAKGPSGRRIETLLEVENFDRSTQSYKTTSH